MNENGVAVKATINRLGSASAGGFKLVLDVPENEADAVSQLLKGYLSKVLSVAFVIAP